MQITVYFHFDHDPEPEAETGVEGNVSDMILPSVGDMVRHADFSGNKIMGRVRQRIFSYEMQQGNGIDGAVSVSVMLEQVMVQ